jgi:hypothetical protein
MLVLAQVLEPLALIAFEVFPDEGGAWVLLIHTHAAPPTLTPHLARPLSCPTLPHTG